ncbi:uncharacterized protein LOC130719340 [Lotus japonicus]|uniref:uncharacterized protein LOC130719340 n=1 Tax=Lotus japonicus TaxID=34305 RepID=UPI002589727C|nr:uncharacterized protein LOC130719340 [Lotus japonicus]
MDWNEMHQIQQRIKQLWRQEEIYWNQRSRVKWLQWGDKNTHFFHASTIQRRETNKITRIKDTFGQWVEGQENLEKAILELYQDIYQTSNPTNLNLDNCMSHVPSKVPAELNAQLMEPFHEEEIKEAVFHLGSMKAPGIDGLNGLFYQKQWNTIKEDVIAAVTELFSTGYLPDSINETLVVLTPKVPNPESLNQYRPISCVNFSYKIITRIIVTRMKPFMEELITPHQSAFVGGRQIQDNLIIVQEAFHKLKRAGPCSRENAAIKLDLNKAFDRIEWEFLRRALLAFGFEEAWVQLIMKLVRGVSYRFKLNGVIGEKLIPQRGIRQGDPLSPYLFIICMDVLSHMLSNNQTSGTLQGLYLRIPAEWGRSKNQSLAWIKGKLLNKIQGWKSLLLNQAGKEILIKSVLQAIPTYSMSLLKFPKGFCIDICAKVANFWWRTKHDKGIHWRKWDILTLNKKEGGMGFKDFEILNQALLAKQAWRMIQQPNSLWAQILKSIYFPNTSLHQAKRGRASSWAWTSILHGRDALLREGRWLVGNRKSINMLSHNWLASGEALLSDTLHEGTAVSAILDGENHHWDIPKIRDLLPPVDLGKILQTPVKLIEGEDEIIWPYRESGIYTVKSGYRQIKKKSISTAPNPSTSSPPLTHLWNKIWSATLPQKIKMFLWKLSQNAIAVKENLWRRKISSDFSCPICDHEEESNYPHFPPL